MVIKLLPLQSRRSFQARVLISLRMQRRKRRSAAQESLDEPSFSSVPAEHFRLVLIRKMTLWTLSWALQTIPST